MQTSSPTHQDSLPSIVDTFEDLIPKELKDAYKEDDVPLAKEQPQMEQDQDPLAFLNTKQPKILDPDIDDDNEDFTSTTDTSNDDIEITSSKDIDDLISGNLDSVSKSAKNKVKQKEEPAYE